jgi:two-component system sensor histidine kinase DegS
VILTVRDNGRGFDALAMRGQALAAGSLGLISMEERARLAGGSLTMQTGPAQGTIVVARFPVTAAHDERQAAGDRS